MILQEKVKNISLFVYDFVKVRQYASITPINNMSFMISS